MASTNWDTIERGTGLLPGILLTTPGRRQQPARSSRHLQCSSRRHRRWRLAPGLQRLVVASEKKRKTGEKREQSNREYSSKVLASKELHYICMGICVRRPYQWTELQNARIRGGQLIPSKTTLLAASVLQHVEESRLKSSK